MQSTKLKYQPTPTQASMLYDACKHLAAARLLFRDLASDYTFPHFVRSVCTGAAADSSFALNRFKNIFSKEKFEKFEQQVTEADPFTVEQIKEMVRRMNPEQQSMIENVCMAIHRGETIQVEKNQTS
ncbi:hypothetical protein PDL71_15280 [Lacibacter sp. MH-610]|uniref:hypothetical protein n=1 Tax=Lacibacter sp. MH-610 TaxID=3020883 RepID=UPI003891E732